MTVITRAKSCNANVAAVASSDKEVSVVTYVKSFDQKYPQALRFDSISTATDRLLTWASANNLGPSKNIRVLLPRVLAVPLSDKLATWSKKTNNVPSICMVANRRRATIAVDLADASTFSLVNVSNQVRTKVRATGSHRFNTMLFSAAVFNSRSRALFVDVKPPLPVGEVQLFVKSLTGQIVTVTIALADTVKEFKIRVQRKLGIPPDQQRLIYPPGEWLSDSKTLEEHGITAEAKMFLTCQLRGGMFVEANGRSDNSELESQEDLGLVNMILSIAGEDKLSIALPADITIANAMRFAQGERALRAAKKHIEELKNRILGPQAPAIYDSSAKRKRASV